MSTLEEIEARWKAATPVNAWAADDRRASAPADIAYLLDRVRKLERALHDEQQARLADETDIGKLQRAHAWLVEQDEFDCSEWGCTTDKGVFAKRYDEDTELYEHNDGCKYVLARDLKL